MELTLRLLVIKNTLLVLKTIQNKDFYADIG